MTTLAAILFSLTQPIISTHLELDSPMSRGHHTGVYDSDAKVFLVYGGVHIEGTYPNGKITNLSDIWAFDGKSWKLLSNTEECRLSPNMAYDTKRKMAVLFGGADPAGGALSRMEFWRGSNWRPVADDLQVARADAGLVYDIAREKLVAFGGWDVRKNAFGDTWEFDASGWKRAAASGPLSRLGLGLAYDQTRKVTVMFGGMSCPPNQTFFDDTWEWDGRSWSHVKVEGPAARSTFGMAYDSKRGRMVIFGGFGASPRPMGDTWAYDGKAWSKLADAGPTPRSMPAMAYDSARDRIVLFGGRDDQAKELGDTWEFDGEKWTRFPG